MITMSYEFNFTYKAISCLNMFKSKKKKYILSFIILMTFKAFFF